MVQHDCFGRYQRERESTVVREAETVLAVDTIE